MKKICLHLLMLLTAILPSIAFSQEVRLPEEELSGLVALSIANNPELKSSHARWQMFANKAKQASSLEDPMFMFKLQNMMARDPFVFNKDPQSAMVIGISQQLPFWGKRALKQEMAQYEADSYQWAVEERKLELARMVKEIYYQLWAVDKGLSVIDKNLAIMSDFLVIAESKYSVGQGVQQDIFKAGLEKTKMLEMRINLVQQRKSLEANLNYLLSRPGNTPVGPIADFELPDMDFTADQLNRMALEKRALIKSLDSLANKGQVSHRLASKEFYPDFNLSFEYMFRESVSTDMVSDPGYNMFTLGVTFNLPFQQDRRRSMLAESASEVCMVAEELNGVKNSISYAVHDALAQLDRRRKLVDLYSGGMIPQAGQSLESAVISYRVNKVDFLTLLDGRLNLYNYERELYESKAEFMMKLAQLESIVGADLVSVQAGEMTPKVIPDQARIPELDSSASGMSHKH